LEKLGIKMGKMMQMLRIAIMGTGTGPDLMLSMEIMGKNEVNLRLEKALAELPSIS
jgi:glutamyl-tRNA synthetase